MFLLLYTVSRLVVLAVVGSLTHASEFSDDTSIHFWLIHHPAFPFFGSTEGILPVVAAGAYPPLMGLLESIPAFAFSWLAPFYAIRLTFLTYEVVGAAFFYLTLERLAWPAERRRLALLAFAILPAGWVTTVVMAQDESIAMAFVAAILYFIVAKDWTKAAIAGGLGLVAGKIFLVLPWYVVLQLAPAKQRKRNFVLSAIPAAVVYGILLVRHWLVPSVTPNFVPSADFGVSVWVLANERWHLLAHELRNLSVPLCAALATVCMGLAERQRKREPGNAAGGAVALTALLLLMVMVAFYHVNPEYYILLLPAWLLLPRTKVEWTGVGLLFTLPWAINFFYGVSRAGAATVGGKAVFVKVYTAIFPFPPDTLFRASLWAIVILGWGIFAYSATHYRSLSERLRPS